MNLFLTLRTFSATGGIEKVCRMAGKAFQEISDRRGGTFRLISMHDGMLETTHPYIDHKNFKGFAGNKIKFVLTSVRWGIKSNCVVLSHIHLALPGLLIKLFSPKTKVIVLAHGIEVWDRKLSPIQKKILKKADRIVAVSNYTKERLISAYSLKEVIVINNCLDPYLPSSFGNSVEVKKKWAFADNDFILLTITRLASTEVNKNYDNIIRVVSQLKDMIPGLKYLLVGKYDDAEKERIETLAAAYEVRDKVFFAGFIPDELLPDYYNTADLYVMPSKKEGFGLTFIEAAYYGLPVIAGNKDGSADALLHGRLGTLIDPDSEEELQRAILKIYNHKEKFLNQRELVRKHFSFEEYKEKWEEVLTVRRSPSIIDRLSTNEKRTTKNEFDNSK